jgi:hypothetical protein
MRGGRRAAIPATCEGQVAAGDEIYLGRIFAMTLHKPVNIILSPTDQ